jgi:hypothetical protein
VTGSASPGVGHLGTRFAAPDRVAADEQVPTAEVIHFVDIDCRPFDAAG